MANHLSSFFNRTVLITVILTFIAFFFSVFSVKAIEKNTLSFEEGFVVLKNQKITLITAFSDEEKTKGLMGVKNLEENQGMIFIFNSPDKRFFWMKGMEISLDLVFVNKNRVVYLYKSSLPCKPNDCPILSPKEKADKVLELKSGFCDRHGVNIGDKAIFFINSSNRQYKSNKIRL